MNPFAWAKQVMKPHINEETTTSECASILRKAGGETFWSDEGTRWAFLQMLSVKTMQALRIRSTRRREIEEPEPGERASRERLYKPPALLDIDDYRDQLQQCVEEGEKYEAKGRRILKEAIGAGFRSLRDEFPEFDVDLD